MECKKCGNDDHQKSTSYLCPEQDKKQKDKFCILASDSNFRIDLFTVKCGFQKFCPNIEIRTAIEDDVNSDAKWKVVFPKDEYYFEQMKGANRPLYDASHRGYLIQSACVVHHMCMQNCGVVHMKSRIIKYFKIRYPGTITRWPAIIQAELFSTNPIAHSREVAEFFLSSASNPIVGFSIWKIDGDH
ncbi:hypothetical protein ABEB36_002088 [Hypothenemus hampei]|uniref:Uncharacterized protein n=1 Tax=Hypothenemus hampei TaxID=57062 RepID=A0ABD1F559_HYPHA